MDEKEVRVRNWNDVNRSLNEILDAIPFTTKQRKDIEYYLDKLEDLFHEANK